MSRQLQGFPEMNWLVVVIVVVLASKAQASLRQVDFGFTSGACMNAEYMLVNSIPLSCNGALETIVDSLPNVTTLGGLGDTICHTYCLYPLRQAAKDCADLADIYDIVHGLCCRNSHGKRCFEAVQSELVTDLQLQCTNETRNTSTEGETCSTNCSVALEEAHSTVGCCLNTVFSQSAVSDAYPFTQLWSKCNQSSTDCTQCSHASTPTATTLLTVIITAVSSIYSVLQ